MASQIKSEIQQPFSGGIQGLPFHTNHSTFSSEWHPYHNDKVVLQLYVMHLDLSAAFDRPSDYTGLTEQLVWPWQCTKVGGQLPCFQSWQISSNPIEQMFGVPKGSVLGALWFIMYTTQHSHGYRTPDETQVYNSSNTTSFRNSTKK